MTCAGENLVQRLPEPERAVPHGDLRRGGEAPGFEVDQELAPALRTLSCAGVETDEFFLALRCGADHDEDALRPGLHPGLEVNPIGPDVDIAARREIAALPALVLLIPLGRAS